MTAMTRADWLVLVVWAFSVSCFALAIRSAWRQAKAVERARGLIMRAQKDAFNHRESLAGKGQRNHRGSR